MTKLEVTGLEPEVLDDLEQIAGERGVSVNEVVLSVVEREVRRRRGRSLVSLALLFGPIVVLVVLILFGD